MMTKTLPRTAIIRDEDEEVDFLMINEVIKGLAEATGESIKTICCYLCSTIGKGVL